MKVRRIHTTLLGKVIQVASVGSLFGRVGAWKDERNLSKETMMYQARLKEAEREVNTLRESVNLAKKKETIEVDQINSDWNSFLTRDPNGVKYAKKIGWVPDQIAPTSTNSNASSNKDKDSKVTYISVGQSKDLPKQSGNRNSNPNKGGGNNNNQNK